MSAIGAKSLAMSKERLGLMAALVMLAEDRKSTRLNSSHANISYAVFCLILLPPRSTLFPYTTLFRSGVEDFPRLCLGERDQLLHAPGRGRRRYDQHDGRRIDERDRRKVLGDVEGEIGIDGRVGDVGGRSEEHTSELQSRQYLVCRLLLDPATSEIYPLSLHDALPIWRRGFPPALPWRARSAPARSWPGSTAVRPARRPPY